MNCSGYAESALGYATVQGIWEHKVQGTGVTHDDVGFVEHQVQTLRVHPAGHAQVHAGMHTLHSVCGWVRVRVACSRYIWYSEISWIGP